MSAEKRPADDELGASQMIVKRQNVGSSTGALARLNASGKSSALVQATPRTSNLQAPVMELSGHSGEIFAAKFDPTGNFIASGSMDRSILLWRTYGDCENYGILNGHRGAILDLQWSRDSKIVFSASADMHLASWDLENGTRIRRYIGHEEIVNTVDLSKRGEDMLVSGSDDGSIGLWDPRSKNAADYIQTEFPITAIAMSEAGNEVYTGGIDNDIKVWDLRKKSVVYSMLGHQDTITSLRVSPDSQSLLSYAMDSTVRTWDIRPFAPTDRAIRTFDGASMGLEKNLIKASWDSEGKKVAVGSGDGTATIWSSETGKLLYKLPGHKGTVNCVEFAPGTEPIVLSASSDRNMLLGELRPRLLMLHQLNILPACSRCGLCGAYAAQRRSTDIQFMYYRITSKPGTFGPSNSYQALVSAICEGTSSQYGSRGA
ncbi:WD repeat domain-containing protein [Colletotrichum lupini]|uniref:WD repeat domain-containing protein n=7 Tax=Colletotrichum acutatum species complex TaxID=2707335 RepID=A0A9Q8SW97_9PEZI|nr:WD repeat domain-containing protein [Colletotrichum lupini]UQC84643.1 WD repeat domain-containing protein [Colletotrichum lupini]